MGTGAERRVDGPAPRPTPRPWTHARRCPRAAAAPDPTRFGTRYLQTSQDHRRGFAHRDATAALARDPQVGQTRFRSRNGPWRTSRQGRAREIAKRRPGSPSPTPPRPACSCSARSPGCCSRDRAAIVAFLVSTGVQVDRATRSGGRSQPRRRNAAAVRARDPVRDRQGPRHPAAIDKSIAAADHPFEEIQEDVRMIVSAMETSAKRAQTDPRHAARPDAGRPRRAGDRGADREAQAALRREGRPRAGQRPRGPAGVARQLRESLERFKINMARLNASSGLMRTRLIEMSAAEEATVQRELTEQARDIRDRTERYTRVLLETSEPTPATTTCSASSTATPPARAARPSSRCATAPSRRPPRRLCASRRPLDTGPRQVPLRNRRSHRRRPSPRRSTKGRARSRCATSPSPRPRPATTARARSTCATARAISARSSLGYVSSSGSSTSGTSHSAASGGSVTSAE